MHRSIASVLLTCTAAVHAFSDSSPFILLSTSNLASSKRPAQLQSSTNVLTSVSELLSSCPTTRYVLVSQPGAHSTDIRRDDASCGMPNLCHSVDRIKSHYSVSEVIGQLATKPLAERIKALCAEKDRDVDVEEVELETLPTAAHGGKRREVLADNDYEIGQLLETLNDDFTLLLFSDPNEFRAYEPSFVEPVHMDLKRQDETMNVGARAGNATRRPGLFETYQFFTPGIFMGLIVLLVMLSILGVGLRALSSLQVSYGAFEKDMGPAAQKKQL